MTFHFQFQIPLRSQYIELKFLLLLKGYTSVSVRNVESHVRGTCIFWKDYCMSQNNYHKSCNYIPASVLPLFLFFFFLCISIATTRDQSSSFQLISLPPFAPVYSAAWSMIVKNGYSEVFSHLGQQARSLARHLKPFRKTWVQVLVPHLGAWTFFLFSTFFITDSSCTFLRF